MSILPLILHGQYIGTHTLQGTGVTEYPEGHLYGCVGFWRGGVILFSGEELDGGTSFPLFSHDCSTLSKIFITSSTHTINISLPKILPTLIAQASLRSLKGFSRSDGYSQVVQSLLDYLFLYLYKKQKPLNFEFFWKLQRQFLLLERCYLLDP